MNLTQLYDHARMMKHVQAGEAIINETHKGSEVQAIQVGDIVKSTDISPYRFNNGKIVDIYEENGYFRYIVRHGKSEKTYRQKDIKK